MDTLLVVVSIFLGGCLLLFCVYKFDIKQKSYEEALAEQRQLASALMKTNTKAKPKDKKTKKAAKKGKEPSSNTTEEKPEEPKPVEEVEEADSKPHVAFSTETEPPKPLENGKKKLGKKEKTRPILVNKDKNLDKGLTSQTNAPSLNHFEQIQPKDDLELLRANSREELLPATKPEKVENAVGKEKKLLENLQIKNKKAKNVVENGPEVATQQNGLPPNSSAKEKKKKKSDLHSLQQIEHDGIISMVLKADLSKSEVQYLIDLLLNKQSGLLDDWSEGKYDPLQKLKKQLAEKEVLYLEEKEAAAGALAKLREVRAEHSAMRTQLQQKTRELDEIKRVELQNEKARSLTLQAKLNEEMVRFRGLSEELTNLQKKNHRINDLEGIIIKLRADIEEITNINNTLKMDLIHQQDELMKKQTYIVQLNNYQQEQEQDKKNLEMNRLELLGERNERSMEFNALQNSFQQQAEEFKRLQQDYFQMQQELQQNKMLNNDNLTMIAQLRNDLEKEKISKINGATELTNLNNERQNKLQQEIVNCKSELKAKEEQLKTIQQELDEQISKNNDLRKKNWKAVEALKATEAKCNEKDAISENKIVEIQRENEDSQKELIKRVFPEVKVTTNIDWDSKDWHISCNQFIRSYLSKLQEQKPDHEVATLKSLVEKYRKTIDETDNHLKSVENSVRQAEINWRNQLKEKNAEIEQLKEELEKDQRTHRMGSEELNGETENCISYSSNGH